MVRNRQFSEAIKRYNAMLTRAKNSDDHRAMAYIFMCLGDVHSYQEELLDKSHVVRTTTQSIGYYQNSIEQIDSVDAVNDDRHLQSLKSFIQELISRAACASPATLSDVLTGDLAKVSLQDSATSTVVVQTPSEVQHVSQPVIKCLSLSLLLPPAVQHIFSMLLSYNKEHISLLTGGAVRDLLLGVTPNDYDIATNARWQYIQQFGEVVGSLHPTCRLSRASGSEIDIDITQISSSDKGMEQDTLVMTTGQIVCTHPSTNIYEDARKRGFTCNALYYDPYRNVVYDCFDGLQHLREKKIVATGNPHQIIAETPRLILSAIRLVLFRGFSVEETLDRAMIDSSSQLNKMNKEYLHAELCKTFPPGLRSVEALAMIQKYNLGAFINDVIPKREVLPVSPLSMDGYGSTGLFGTGNATLSPHAPHSVLNPQSSLT
jgi:hypothetical protein